MLGLWWTLLPTIGAMAIVAILPTCLWVRAWVKSSVVAVGVAPAITFAIIMGLSVLFDAANVPWEKAKVFPILGLLSALGAITWLFVEARRSGGGSLQPGGIVASLGPRRPLGELQSRVRASTWGMIAVGTLLAALPMLTNADPRMPAQQWDSTFHLNGVWSMLSTRVASPFGGLSELYGGREVFYPTTWHAFAALFATPTSVIEVSNASSILLMAVWVIGATAFTSVLTDKRGAILAAPVLAGTLLNMPADNLTMYNQWPLAMGLAAVPGVAAFAVIVGRRVLDAWKRSAVAVVRHTPTILALLFAAAGATAAHPSSAFTLVVMLIAPLLASLIRFVEWASFRRRRAAALIAAAGAIAALVVPLWLLTTDRISAMGRYPRAGVSWSMALSRMFIPVPPFQSTGSLALLIGVQAILLFVGVVTILGLWRSLATMIRADDPTGGESDDTTLDGAESGDTDPGDAESAEKAPDPPEPEGASAADADPDETGPLVPPSFPEPPPVKARPREHLLWPIAAYLIFSALTALAYAPIGDLRTFLLAPWYLDARRIMGVHGLMMVPIMAIGFEQITAGAHRWVEGLVLPQPRPYSRWRTDAFIGAILIVVTGFGAFDARVWATDYVYDAQHLGKPGMATTAELAMIRRMRLRIPRESLVLGDPIAGAAYVEVIGQHEAVFPQLTLTNNEERWQQVLTRRFNEIHTNPDVCDVVRELGITHFYEDEDGWYYNFRRSSRFPGLYNVDTSTGFELVDTGGTAKLWKITACDAG